MEARVVQIVPVAESTTTMVLGRIVRFHVQSDLLREDGLVDTAALRPVTRLGGSDYARLGEIFTLKRPIVPPEP